MISRQKKASSTFALQYGKRAESATLARRHAATSSEAVTSHPHDSVFAELKIKSEATEHRTGNSEVVDVIDDPCIVVEDKHAGNAASKGL